MNTKKQYTVQLETLPYLIKCYHTNNKYYCCKGKWIKARHPSLINTKLFIHFRIDDYIWSYSSFPLMGYKIVEKITNLTYFLDRIKQANPEIQFIINGKKI